MIPIKHAELHINFPTFLFFNFFLPLVLESLSSGFSHPSLSLVLDTADLMGLDLTSKRQINHEVSRLIGTVLAGFHAERLSSSQRLWGMMNCTF